MPSLLMTSLITQAYSPTLHSEWVSSWGGARGYKLEYETLWAEWNGGQGVEFRPPPATPAQHLGRQIGKRENCKWSEKTCLCVYARVCTERRPSRGVWWAPSLVYSLLSPDKVYSSATTATMKTQSRTKISITPQFAPAPLQSSLPLSGSLLFTHDVVIRGSFFYYCYY